MSDWVSVPEIVMAQALKLVAGGTVDVNSTADFPVALVDGLIEFFREAGGCDHSVGIFCCEEEGAVYELQLAKDGKQICNDCGGDGTAWSQEKYDAEREAASAGGLYADDFAGMIKCPGCDGKGILEITGTVQPPSVLERV